MLCGVKGSTAAWFGGHGCGQGSWAIHRPTNQTVSAFRWQHGRLVLPSQITTTGQLRTTDIPRVPDLGPGSPSSLQVGLVPRRPKGRPVLVCPQLLRLLTIRGVPWPKKYHCTSASILTPPSSLAVWVPNLPVASLIRIPVTGFRVQPKSWKIAS